MSACRACVMLLKPRYETLIMKLMRARHFNHICVLFSGFGRSRHRVIFEELLTYTTFDMLKRGLHFEIVDRNLL